MKSLTYILTVIIAAFLLWQCKSEVVEPEVPVAAFSVENEGCNAPCMVSFINESENATSFKWDFGDGTVSDLENPTHLYIDPNTYTVRLTAKKDSLTDEAVQSVSILPPIRFEATLGGAGEEYGNDLLQVPGGGYVLVGSSTSSGNGTKDIYLVFTDINGNQLEEKFIDISQGDETANAIIATSGGYAIAGSTVKNENTDGFLIFVDENGNIFSNKTQIFDGPGGEFTKDQIYDLTLLSNGQIALAGQTYSEGNTDIYLIVTEEDKTPSVEKKIGEIQHYEATRSIIQANDGRLVMTGEVTDGTYIYASVVFTDIYGNAVEMKKHGPVYAESESNVVIQLPNNQFAIAGGEGYRGNGFLYKVDMNGNLVHEFTGVHGVHQDMVSTSDGGFVLVGYDGEHYSGYNPSIVRLDAEGNKIWSRTFIEDIEFESFQAIIASEQDGYAVLGYTHPPDFYFIKTDPDGNTN